MTNEQMKAGRFLKMQNGRRTLARILAPLKTGKRIVIGTTVRSVRYTPKLIDMFKLGASGDVYVQRGKGWDCLTFGGVMAGCGLAVEG